MKGYASKNRNIQPAIFVGCLGYSKRHFNLLMVLMPPKEDACCPGLPPSANDVVLGLPLIISVTPRRLVRLPSDESRSVTFQEQMHEEKLSTAISPWKIRSSAPCPGHKELPPLSVERRMLKETSTHTPVSPVFHQRCIGFF